MIPFSFNMYSRHRRMLGLSFHRYLSCPRYVPPLTPIIYLLVMAPSEQHLMVLWLFTYWATTSVTGTCLLTIIT